MVRQPRFGRVAANAGTGVHAGVTAAASPSVSTGNAAARLKADEGDVARNETPPTAQVGSKTAARAKAWGSGRVERRARWVTLAHGGAWRRRGRGRGRAHRAAIARATPRDKDAILSQLDHRNPLLGLSSHTPARLPAISHTLQNNSIFNP